MKKSYSCVLVAALLSAGAASAAEVAVHVDQHGEDLTEMFMSGDADGLMHLGATATLTARDGDGSGLDGAAGKCFGLGHLVRGMMEGAGGCSYTAANGDMFQVEWTILPGDGSNGTWTVAGGTGRWAGSIGGGVWYDFESNGERVTKIDGAIVIN